MEVPQTSRIGGPKLGEVERQGRGRGTETERAERSLDPHIGVKRVSRLGSRGKHEGMVLKSQEMTERSRGGKDLPRSSHA